MDASRQYATCRMVTSSGSTPACCDKRRMQPRRRWIVFTDQPAARPNISQSSKIAAAGSGGTSRRAGALT